MSSKRKIKDAIYNIMTGLASSISIIILISILSFVVIKGKGTLSLEMLKNDYWSENYLVSFPQDDEAIDYSGINLKEGQYLSHKYGIIIEDTINHENENQVIFTTILKDSIFGKSLNETSGPQKGKLRVVENGDFIEKIVLINEDGSKTSKGMIYKTSAKELAFALDNSASLDSLYYKTPGGGIWGSLLATLKLILLSLLIALPLGIFTAIYLNEMASDNFVTKFMGYSIDLLAGVPSIIFGLMGVIVLYPITQLFKVKGLSILLGSLTMSVILLPIIIKTIQESLKTVPDGLRMASLSLGANETQTVFKVVLPSAMSGILSATLLAISRIIGESAALIYTMGTFINDSPKIGEGATSLAVHIWSVMSQEQPNFELASAISLIILLIVLILNVSIKLLSYKFERRLSQ